MESTKHDGQELKSELTKFTIGNLEGLHQQANRYLKLTANIVS